MKRGRLAGFGVVLMVALVSSGCVARVSLPENMQDPQTFFLVDHGRHSSLVIPDDEDGLIRYTYGEWEWYVMENQGLMSGLTAMLWPTTGALGRQHYEAMEAPPLPMHITPEGCERVYPLEAEASRINALRDSLEARFETDQDEPTYGERYDLFFVPVPRSYWLGYQSNQVMANWLQQLGLEVSGSPWLSRWRLPE